MGLPSRCSIILLLGVTAQGCLYRFDRAWTDDGGSTTPKEGGIVASDLRPAPDLAAPVDVSAPPDAPGPPDTLAPDLSVDTTSAPPCGSGAPMESYGATMVICALGAAGSQCEAANACNGPGGWTLCTATQFLARGGRDKPTAADAWLAACIRSGGAPHAPTDKICGPCTAKPIASMDVAWPCPPIGGSNYGNGDFVGVGPSNECLRVGQNDAASQAFWEPGRLNVPRTAAVCCR